MNNIDYNTERARKKQLFLENELREKIRVWKSCDISTFIDGNWKIKINKKIAK